MLAVVKSKPGPGLDLLEVENPILGPDQILLKVEAAGICGSDVHIYKWTSGYEWMSLPVIIGHEFSAIVLECGRNVEALREGTAVVCMPVVPCGKCLTCKSGRVNICERSQGLGLHMNGAFAKYVLVPKGIAGIFPIPKSVDFEVAALCEPFSVALHAIETSKIEIGGSAVVIGPGPIGLLTVLGLKYVGFNQVFIAGLRKDKKRLQFAEKLGATSINVDEENLVEIVNKSTNGKGVNVVFEASGSPVALSQAISIVKRGGEIIIIGIHSGTSNINLIPVVRREICVKGSYGYTYSTWNKVVALLPKLQSNLKSLVTHVLPLSEFLKGFKLAESGSAIKVILKP